MSIKTKVNLLLLMLSLNFSFSQHINYEWGLSIGGTSYDYGISTTTDSAGNVYFVGTFSGTVDFDPGPDNYYVTPTTASTYILKLDANGDFLWVRYIETDYVYEITTDDNGNTYTIGSFKNIVDFDPGPNENNLTSLGNTDIFILKLDTDGIFVWVKKIGGTGYDNINDVKIDDLGNIYAVGGFIDVVDFDPGNDTFYMFALHQHNAFVLKLDNNGDFVWAIQIEGDTNSVAASIDFDSEYNSYITGSFQGEVDFDPSNDQYLLPSSGSSDLYILKLNEIGDFVWAERIGGASSDYGVSLAVGSNNNVYLTGNYHNTVDFNPGEQTFFLTSEGYNDIFILKLDSNGSFLWANSKGNDNHGDDAHALALDSFDFVYTTGGFGGTIDFNPDSDTYFLTSNGWSDAFIQILSPDGHFIWATNMGDVSYDYGNDIHIKGNNIYTTGHYQYSINLDPDNNVDDFISNGNTDAFGQKFFFPDMAVHSPIQDYKQIYPNPASQMIHIPNILNSHIQIVDVTGRIVLDVYNTDSSILSIKELNKGVYFVSIKNSKGNFIINQKIIKGN